MRNSKRNFECSNPYHLTFFDVQLYHIPQKENQQANALVQHAFKEVVVTLAPITLKPPRLEGVEALDPIFNYILEGELPLFSHPYKGSGSSNEQALSCG